MVKKAGIRFGINIEKIISILMFTVSVIMGYGRQKDSDGYHKKIFPR
jgi:hypothetical protein